MTDEGRDADTVGLLVALAFPDRIARARGAPGEVVMANGRGASLPPESRLARERYLAVAEIAGAAGSARILAAAPLSAPAIETAFADRIESREILGFDDEAKALRARAVRRLGAVVLEERPLPVPATEEAARILARGLARLPLSALPWTPALSQWRARVAFLAATDAGGGWPDLREATLAATMEEWLAPHIVGRASLAAINADDLAGALHALLPWPLPQRLEAQAPSHVEVPTGSRLPVDYEAEDGPVLAVRVQELFGLTDHPTVGAGTPLLLHLLSPAHRPIQVTRDLPGFWRGSWADVRAQMRGRYPRHPWPENPLEAEATRRAKPRKA